MRWLCLVALLGCRFTPGQVADDALVVGDDVLVDDAGGGDAGADADTPATCNARWLDGTIRFGTPVPLTTINSSAYDRDPFLTPDEKTIWISSGRAGGMNGSVWIAKRASTADDFSTPAVDPDFESAGNETKLSQTADGLVAVVGSDRNPSANVDVWEATRATVNDNWSPLSRTNLGSVNTSGSDHDPTISADGLRIYLAPDSPSPQHIAVATRADRASAFGMPTTLTELSSGVGDADPSPTPDERILLFASNRDPGPSGPNAPNVYYATRATSTGTFDAPLLVPDINDDNGEGDPHLSSDGCRIYFARTGANDFDIYVATALP